MTQDNNAACNLILALEEEELTVEALGQGQGQQVRDIIIIIIFIINNFIVRESSWTNPNLVDNFGQKQGLRQIYRHSVDIS